MPSIIAEVAGATLLPSAKNADRWTCHMYAWPYCTVSIDTQCICIYNYIDIDTTYVVYDSVFDSLPYYMIWNIYIYMSYTVCVYYIYTDIDFHGETTIWLGLSRGPTRWINALLAPSAIMTKLTGQDSLQYKTYQWNMNKTHTTDSRRNLSGQQKQKNIYPLVI